MGIFCNDDGVFIDRSAKASRVLLVSAQGKAESVVEMVTHVFTGISSDDVAATKVLSADPHRISARLVTDAMFLAIGPDNTVNVNDDYLMVFAYSGLIPEVLRTNGEVWCRVVAPDVTPVTGNIRILVERRSVN